MVDLRGLLAFLGVDALLSAVSQRGHHGLGYQHAITNYLIEFILQVIQHIDSSDEQPVMQENRLDLA